MVTSRRNIESYLSAYVRLGEGAGRVEANVDSHHLCVYPILTLSDTIAFSSPRARISYRLNWYRSRFKQYRRLYQSRISWLR
jgi:hypothetical protein